LNLFKTNLLKNKIKNETQGIDTFKHFPSSTREWNNSIYVYNKNALNLIPITSLYVTKIIKSYFSLINFKIERKLRTRKLPTRFRKLSSNRIFIGNNEFKHTNNKVLINLYLFNREKNNYLAFLKKRFIRFFNLKKYNAKKRILRKYKNHNIKKYDLRKNNIRNFNNKNYKNLSTKLNFLKSMSSLLFKDYEKKKYSIISIFKKVIEKHLVIQKDKVIWKKNYFIPQIYFWTFYKKFVKKSLKKLQLYFYYRQLININRSKFNYTYLQYLKKYLQTIYNKNIEFNLINLKRFYINSDILSESIRLKITKNRRRILRHLNKLKNKVRIQKKSTLLFEPIYDNNILAVNNSINSQENITVMYKNIFNSLKYRDVTGFRLEAKGRLGRRHTASRTVFKVKYKGNLLNIDSSHKGLSTVLLKGNLDSNLQYTKLKSKTRIGSFGLKGWVSGN
jgi:hypothetical protein